MKLTKLNKYREIRSTIAANERILQAGSKYLYEDDRLPATIAELTNKTTALKKHCSENYGDVVEFLGSASLSDYTTGIVLQEYYHGVQSWEQVGAKCGMSAGEAKALAAAYTKAHCEKDPDPKPAAPAPGHRASGRPAMPGSRGMHMPGGGHIPGFPPVKL